MDADRRRRIAIDLLAAIDAIPVGPDGRGDFNLDDLVASTKLEAELVGRLTDEMERGHAVRKALDSALILLDGGGWRHITRAELAGDDAAAFSRAFRDQAVTDK